MAGTTVYTLQLDADKSLKMNRKLPNLFCTQYNTENVYGAKNLRKPEHSPNKKPLAISNPLKILISQQVNEYYACTLMRVC